MPLYWCVFWYALALPVVVYGAYKMRKLMKANRDVLPLLAVSGAFIFVLSSLKMPSVTGSCSHPTGTGMGAILFGPWITSVLSIIVLIYQAIFLAHGGLTTLGANTFSMGIAGPIVGYLVYKGSMKSGINMYIAVFLAALFADWATYIVTSIQLALAFPAASAESGIFRGIPGRLCHNPGSPGHCGGSCDCAHVQVHRPAQKRCLAKAKCGVS